MADSSPEQLIDLICRKAESLRAAGILEITFAGMGVKLAPKEPVSDWQPEKGEPEEVADPFASMPLPHLQIADDKARS